MVLLAPVAAAAVAAADLRAEKHESKARGLAEEKREGAAIEESC